MTCVDSLRQLSKSTVDRDTAIWNEQLRWPAASGGERAMITVIHLRFGGLINGRAQNKSFRWCSSVVRVCVTCEMRSARVRENTATWNVTATHFYLLFLPLPHCLNASMLIVVVVIGVGAGVSFVVSKVLNKRLRNTHTHTHLRLNLEYEIWTDWKRERNATPIDSAVVDCELNMNERYRVAPYRIQLNFKYHSIILYSFSFGSLVGERWPCERNHTCMRCGFGL